MCRITLQWAIRFVPSFVINHKVNAKSRFSSSTVIYPILSMMTWSLPVVRTLSVTVLMDVNHWLVPVGENWHKMPAYIITNIFNQWHRTTWSIMTNRCRHPFRHRSSAKVTTIVAILIIWRKTSSDIRSTCPSAYISFTRAPFLVIGVFKWYPIHILFTKEKKNVPHKSANLPH